MNRRSVRIGLAVTAVILSGCILVFHPSRPLYTKERSIQVIAADGIVLAGTLSLPRWARQPVPAVVIVHGSGPRTRNDLRGDIRHLVRAGIAVLAYDKRGAGASQGVYPRGWGNDAESTLRILAGDAAAALDRLRQEPGIDPTRVGYFGASQAGWIIPLAAELLTPPPRFHVILSGAAVSTGVEEFYSRLTGDGQRPPELADDSEIRERVTAFSGPAGFEPAHLLQASHVPTLWLLGERDASVPTFASVHVLDSIRAAGNLSHTVIVYADADHALRIVTTGGPAPLWADALRWLQDNGVVR
jgi:dienelactone hydrolase